MLNLTNYSRTKFLKVGRYDIAQPGNKNTHKTNNILLFYLDYVTIIYYDK
jgi:hypothetical protein